MKKLEIACCNLDSVIAANNGGASRIELFENLPNGGCTPSYGMIKKSKEVSSIPIYVMIRPRAGGFVYNRDELDIMQNDIEICKQLKVDGIVFGVLDENKHIDTDKCKELLKLWNNKSATFHRAVDITMDLDKSIRSIIELGFERVLTSGGKTTAIEGVDTILNMNRKYKDKISVMAGSGITSGNVQLFSELNEVHATCKVIKEDNEMFGKYTISEAATIGELRQKFIG